MTTWKSITNIVGMVLAPCSSSSSSSRASSSAHVVRGTVVEIVEWVSQCSLRLLIATAFHVPVIGPYCCLLPL